MRQNELPTLLNASRLPVTVSDAHVRYPACVITGFSNLPIAENRIPAMLLYPYALTQLRFNPHNTAETDSCARTARAVLNGGKSVYFLKNKPFIIVHP
ncbi:hypothetical protein M514_25023, partial [Trichuris suis]